MTTARTLSLAFLAFLVFFKPAFAQIVINEASNRNYTQVLDEDDENEDWVELFNAGIDDVNLQGWFLTDRKNNPTKWQFPAYDLKPKQFALIMASGKNRKTVTKIQAWESAVLPRHSFRYLLPNNDMQKQWTLPEFDDSAWEKGQAGFGYGDNDDETNVPSGTAVVYVRKVFHMSDISNIAKAICHVDYDDGFVAYLNGTEICRGNINGDPSWNSFSNGLREGSMYGGGLPEKFEIDTILIQESLVQGENVFAVEVHNTSSSSSDLSLIPFLTFGLKSGSGQFDPVPDWFKEPLMSYLHTSFKIASEGETIYLFNPALQIVDSLFVGNLPLDFSIGKKKDGATSLGLYEQATPGYSNNGSVAYNNEFEPKPSFSQAAGHYSSSIQLAISSSSPSCQIRYTTDGSTPTEDATLYNNHSIRISSTQTIRARCYSTSGKLPGKVATSTYLINNQHTVPILAVSTNNENLFGQAGIFDNWQEDWNKPCYVEYFDMEGERAFHQNAGIQIDGGAGGSRSQPQHSFRIEPGNNLFGDGDLFYNLIPDRPSREQYASFYLRNGSNQYLVLPYKDALEVKAMSKGTYNYYSAFTPMVVYINGEYFGLYETREKINADYLRSNYGMENDSLDLIGVSYWKGSGLDPLEGSAEPFWEGLEDFNQLNHRSSDFLINADQFVDLNNYTDYIIAQNWMANTDWPFNNIKIFRNKATGMRWRFALIDLEWSLEPNGWSNSSTNAFEFIDSRGGNTYVSIFHKLMQNQEYENYYLNRYADLLNTRYSFETIGPMEMELYEKMLPEMEEEYGRWGNGNIQSQLNTFTKNHETFRSELEARTPIVREHAVDFHDLDGLVEINLDVEPKGAGKIKISTIMPEHLPWSGIYFQGIPVTLEAIALPSFEFDGWEESTFISNEDNPTQSIDFNEENAQLKARFKPSKKVSGGVIVSELNYKNNGCDWVELYNTGSETVNLGGWYLVDSDASHRYTLPVTANLTPHAHLVLVRDMDAFKKNYPNVKNTVGSFGFGFGTPSDKVRLFDKNDNLVVEVAYNDHFPWPLGGVETGQTLELLSTSGDYCSHQNWFAGCKGGSPGKAYGACPENSDIQSIVETKRELLVFPVPAKESVTLGFSLLQQTKFCSMKIFNLQGVLLKEQKLGAISQGYHYKKVLLEGIENGMLLVTLETDQFCKNSLFVKVE